MLLCMVGVVIGGKLLITPWWIVLSIHTWVVGLCICNLVTIIKVAVAILFLIGQFMNTHDSIFQQFYQFTNYLCLPLSGIHQVLLKWACNINWCWYILKCISCTLCNYNSTADNCSCVEYPGPNPPSFVRDDYYCDSGTNGCPSSSTFYYE